ncbi:MAG TPA: hypothetical protein VFH22_08180, partial [Rhodocyclaceae bacterium]|nr:hypothetical protein [Rhodocyclaceae bacterium]
MNCSANSPPPAVDQARATPCGLQENPPDAAAKARPAGPAAAGSGPEPGFAAAAAAGPVRAGTWRFAPAAAALSGSAIREILKVTERPEILSFAGGLPTPAAFPVAAVQEASRRILRDDAVGALQYGPTE